ncbi:hypothetical protein PF006_g30798 [Phytophthora fragariae]|uniref:Uncharacterized protein n=1 Tax=Phytophthora fragariae TaxID=53985 RepID=A0A6A3PU73_9STRA|nr:hypothetical protein PF006_g30798 [Phytophthora fragariae]
MASNSPTNEVQQSQPAQACCLVILTGIAATRQLSARIQTELGLEEYTGYIHPCDEQSQSDLKLLQVAQLGK